MQIDQMVRHWLHIARSRLAHVASLRPWNLQGAEWRRWHGRSVSGLYPNRSALRSELRIRTGR
jgi:hypothetical protein